ncbi:MAG TPA: aminotransferase class I/II-fold pyridoxal phosphate-dependent enzyme [Bacteroidia bacterium]|nr:aminotransferase class I/II-fold pyridoxal phosphate-dependent enzyme [Bacteroidia bacterium]
MTSAFEKINTINSEFKEKTFITDAGNGASYTFGHLEVESRAIAWQLEQTGLKKGDRIVFSLENSLEFVKLYFACLYSGIVSIPLNPVLSPEQKDYIIGHSEARAIVFSDTTLPGFNRQTIESPQTLNFRLDSQASVLVAHNGKIRIDLKNGPGKKMIIPFDRVHEDDPLIIIYTSGTTSNPKGVIHSLKSLVSNAVLFNSTVGITEENIFFNNMAMTYLGGYYNLMLLPFTAGASVVLSTVFDARAIINFWEKIIQYKANTLWIVPTVISILNEFDRGNTGTAYCREHVKLALTGTAPLSEPVREKFENKYGIPLIENYALSETLFLTTDRPAEKRVAGSVGRVINGVQIKIVDADNQTLPVGDEGEIVIDTPSLMKGYFNVDDPLLKETANPFSTGDIGRLDENNNLYVTGRKKDLIIRGGINISPKAIEDVIHSVDGVVECAVVGVADKISGEEIVAVVKLSESATLSSVSAKINELCRAKLSSNQIPSFVFELPDFPKTSSNKIQKNKIRTWLEEKIRTSKETKRVSIKNNPGFFKASTVVENSIQAVSIRYNNLVYELQQQGEDITVLSLGEAFFDIPLFPFDDLSVPAIYHYTHSRGTPELRQNLKKYFERHFEFGFDPDKEIVVTAGSKIAIHMALMALLNPGDEVIIHEPAWVSYPEQVKLCYGVPVQIPYHESVFDFEKFITNRTKVIIINSPNNPTGKLFTIEELSHLNKLAIQYNLFILSDEAYSDFTAKGQQFISLGNLDRTFSHSIIVNSISKNYGISGWRLGYIVTNERLTDQILKLNQHLITCPPSILQYYITKHFDEIIKITKPQILAVVEKRNAVLEFINGLGMTALPGTATFYLFVSIQPTRLSSEEFCTQLLNEKHVSAVPGSGYGRSCDGFVRISIGTEPMDRIKNGVVAIKNLIDATK